MKDSIGNELPKHYMLCSGATAQETGYALTINTFLLAAELAMEKGHIVIYSAERKQATVHAASGMASIISHG